MIGSQYTTTETCSTRAGLYMQCVVLPKNAHPKHSELTGGGESSAIPAFAPAPALSSADIQAGFSACSFVVAPCRSTARDWEM